MTASTAVEQRVEVSPGVELATRVWTGGDPTFVLVHGLASNARLWDGVAGVLSDAGFHVVAVDLRGHGVSDQPPDGYDTGTAARDVGVVVEALASDRPVVAGQSWGGNVVVELAARRPELVRGIACVDGGTIELASRFASWEECAVALAPPPLSGTPVASLLERLRVMHPDWSDEAVAATLANFVVRDDGTVEPRLTRERHMSILRSLWEHHPSRLFGTLTVPVLLIPAGRRVWGDEAAAGAMGNVRVCAFPDADHDVHAQRPREVADVLLGAVNDGFFS